MKPTSLDDSERFVVTQSNYLVEANYPVSMTARAHKIARLIVSLINPNDDELKGYTIKTDKLKQYLGLSDSMRWGAFYKELNDIQDRINRKPIVIKKPDGGYIRSPFLILETTPKEGTVTFHIPEKIKPYLINLKDNYTSYQLVHIPKLRSGYSIRLYELLHQYRKIGKRFFELEDLKQKVGGAKYKFYGNFKQKVLQQAQKELKKHTDLAFVFDEKRAGRKVTGIEFVIFGNTPQKENTAQLSLLQDAIETEEDQEAPAFSEDIATALNKLGISEQNIAKYLSQGFDIIADEKKRGEALERCTTIGNYYLEKFGVLEHSTSAQLKENRAGFFIKALKEDWTNSKSLQKRSSEKTKQERIKARKRVASLEQAIENNTKKMESLNEPIYTKLLADQTTFKSVHKKAVDEMGEFFEKHYGNILKKPIREQYQENSFLKSSIRVELWNRFPEKFSQGKKLQQKIDEARSEVDALKKQFILN